MPLSTLIYRPLHSAEIYAALDRLLPVKNELYHYFLLLSDPPRTLLLEFEMHKPIHNRWYWKKFNPRERTHTGLLAETFRRKLLEVIREEDVLDARFKGWGVLGGLGNVIVDFLMARKGMQVEEVVARWGIDVQQRSLGRYLLRSWEGDQVVSFGVENEAGKEEEEEEEEKEEEGGNLAPSFDMREFMEVCIRIWDEEVVKVYPWFFPEEFAKEKEQRKVISKRLVTSEDPVPADKDSNRRPELAMTIHDGGPVRGPGVEGNKNAIYDTRNGGDVGRGRLGRAATNGDSMRGPSGPRLRRPNRVDTSQRESYLKTHWMDTPNGSEFRRRGLLGYAAGAA